MTDEKQRLITAAITACGKGLLGFPATVKQRRQCRRYSAGWQAEVAPPNNHHGGIYESYGRRKKYSVSM